MGYARSAEPLVCRAIISYVLWHPHAKHRHHLNNLKLSIALQETDSDALSARAMMTLAVHHAVGLVRMGPMCS